MRDHGRAVTRRPVWMGLVGTSSAWLVVIGLVAGYFALLIALGGHSGWRELGVPPVSPGFFDLRSVTSGWECARQHLGEWPENPCDPWGRPENYPRIWIAASVLGLGQDDTYFIGTLIVVGFFAAAIVVLPRSAPIGDALVYALALCSPAVMLGVERGNVDLALFGIVTVAGLVMRRMPRGPAVASALILLAAILKLFPIAAVGMLTGLPRRAAVLCTTSVVGLFTVYAAATFRDIQTIDRVLPQDDEYAYGLHIVGGWLGRLAGSGRVWDAALVALTAVAALAFRRSLASRLAMRPSRELDFFCAGAGIYVATFALVRSADYRLVFLLLAIPQLVRWAAAGRGFALATLLAIVITLWFPTEWGWTNVPVLDDVIREWSDAVVAGGVALPLAAPAQLVAFIGLACLLAAVVQGNWDREPVDIPATAAWGAAAPTGATATPVGDGSTPAVQFKAGS